MRAGQDARRLVGGCIRSARGTFILALCALLLAAPYRPSALAQHNPPQLDPIPINCPAGPKPTRFWAGGPGVGNSLVRLAFDGRWEAGPSVRLHLAPSGQRHDPAYFKILPFLQLAAKRVITLRGWNLGTGRPIVWQSEHNGVTARNVLDPARSAVQPESASHGWAEAGLAATLFPSAGCYVFFAQWRDGALLIPVAAGR